jgi:hypothetical protein
MKSPKTILIAVTLLAAGLTAWAGENSDARTVPEQDKTVVAPAQPTVKAAASKQPAQSKTRVVPSRTSPKRAESVTVSQSAPRREPSRESEPAGKVEAARRPRGGRGRGPGPGFPSWRHRRDDWRRRHYRGSWHFLWHFGPVIYPAPVHVHVPHVVRLPRHRVGVFVRHTGEDYVGKEFARSVRNHLRAEGLRVVYSSGDAQLELYVVSMEQDPDDPGYGSAVSVSYVWYPGNKFITAQMLDVGIDQVGDLARSVAGYADDLVGQYR